MDTSKSSPTLVLLDIDGTLLLGRGSGRAATELAMMEVFGTIGKLHEYRFAGKTDFYTLVELLSPEGYTEAQIAETLPHYSAVLTRHMESVVHQYNLHALPGAVELVERLSAHDDVLLGLITGNVLQMAQLKLSMVGINPSAFQIAAYGTEARIRRELVPLVVGRAEVHAGVKFAPEHIVFVGDTTDDIDCAHSIGARMIAVTTGMASREELEAHPPVTVLADLSDVDHVMRLILGTNA